MLPGEELCAFLDNVCILCAPERCKILCELLVNWFFLKEIASECMQGRRVKSSWRVPTRCATEARARLEEEDKLWRVLSWVPELQCTWQLLVQCASHRCHYLLRITPPSQVVGCPAGQNEGSRNSKHRIASATGWTGHSFSNLDEPCCMLGFVGRPRRLH